MLHTAKSRRARKPYFKFFADDWLSGTMELSFEELGAYIQVLAVQWSRRAPLPMDILPTMLGRDPRSTRRLVQSLIDKGKLTLGEGVVFNIRMAAVMGCTDEALPADLPEISATFPANVREISSEHPADVSESVPKNTNENNEPSTRMVSYTRAFHFHSHSHRKKDSQLASVVPDAERGVAAAGPPPLAGLNGSSAEIIEGVGRLLRPWGDTPDRETAQRVLASLVGAYGPDAVRDGYADLATQVAADRPVIAPLKALTGFVKAAAAKRNQPSEPPWKREKREKREAFQAMLARLSAEEAVAHG